MRPSDFDYELPGDRIAQHPLERRDAARLLVHDIAADRTEHRLVGDLPDLLRRGDLLVLNDTRVLPARLFGRRRSGGAVELLLTEPVAGKPRIWRALANPARRLKPGERLEVEGGALEARLVEREGSRWLLELVDPRRPEAAVEELLERHGRTPLPPYITRAGRSQRLRGEPEDPMDRERYQTVYAARPGAIAAPTAGLHFTPELLEGLGERGIRRTRVTLHVGPGTFQQVEADDIEDHRMHAERFELPAEAVRAIDGARARGGRVVAVGTTSVRVLESQADGAGTLAAGRGETNLFLRPGSTFRVVDAILTNFHLPRSSLLMLVSAFAGRGRILELYREAIDRRYRFYSFGDAMLLLNPPGR